MKNNMVGSKIHKNKIFKNDVYKCIEASDTIAIGGHVRPDGDCTGSCLAFYQYIRKVYPDKKVYVYSDKIPEIFNYIKGYEAASSEDLPESPDLFISLDCSSIDRLVDGGKRFSEAKYTVNIDHHISNTGFAQINMVESAASSTCEVIFGLFDEDVIDSDIATALYTGIIHDTGVFAYSNTSRRTMEIGGFLIEKGIDTDRIIDESFYEKTYKQNLLLGRCLLESRLILDGRCIISVATREIMDEYEATPEDFEGIVNQLRITKGVKVAIFIYQLSEDEYKVSMRANGSVDVSRAAVVFGGGGHVKAAGCSLRGNLKEELDKLIDEVKKQIEISEK